MSGDDGIFTVPDSPAELHDLELATWQATTNRIQACCHELGRLDDFAMPGDPTELQLHAPPLADPWQERRVLLRRWLYDRTRYISEIVVTDSHFKRGSDEVTIDNAVFRIDRNASARAITGDYHHGFASGRELFLPERAGATIWRRADDSLGLEYGVVDSQRVPHDFCEGLDEFIAGRIASKRLLESICNLDSDTLVTDFQFAPE